MTSEVVTLLYVKEIIQTKGQVSAFMAIQAKERAANHLLGVPQRVTGNASFI